MAARVQNDDGAGGEALEGLRHAGKVDFARRGVVVRILLNLEAGTFEQGAMVLPARRADPHLGAGVKALQKIGSNLQRTRPAECLRANDAALLQRCGASAKDELLHRLHITRNAVDR
jgi:hypothetical protein